MFEIKESTFKITLAVVVSVVITAFLMTMLWEARFIKAWEDFYVAEDEAKMQELQGYSEDEIISKFIANSKMKVLMYDGKGRLVSYRYKGGSAITFTYDGYDRIVGCTYPFDVSITKQKVNSRVKK